MSPTVKYWRFEVIYTSSSGTGSSILDFNRNDPPKNGSCSIDPHHGTISSLFNISCSNWLDEDEIEDYSLYGKIEYSTKLISSSCFLVENPDPTKRLMIAFSCVSTFEVQLPSGALNLTIIIRDKSDSTTEWNLPSILVQTNPEEISAFLDYLQNPSNELNSHPMARRLASGNQNIVAQMGIIFSRELNVEDLISVFLDNETKGIDNLNWTDGIPVTKVVVAPLGSARLMKVKKQDFCLEKLIDMNRNTYPWMKQSSKNIRDY